MLRSSNGRAVALHATDGSSILSRSTKQLTHSEMVITLVFDTSISGSSPDGSAKHTAPWYEYATDQPVCIRCSIASVPIAKRLSYGMTMQTVREPLTLRRQRAINVSLELRVWVVMANACGIPNPCGLGSIPSWPANLMAL